MKEGIEGETRDNLRPLLSLEEFRIQQNNFWMYFVDGDMGDSRRKSPHYQKFVENHPELEAQLREKMMEVYDYIKRKKVPLEDSPYRDVPGLEWADILKRNMILPIYAEMYEVYKIMRSYVKDDYELTR